MTAGSRDSTLDARGLLCPLPLTLARRAMRAVAPGGALVVLATDPEAPIDLAAWAADEGLLFRARERDGFLELELRRKS